MDNLEQFNPTDLDPNANDQLGEWIALAYKELSEDEFIKEFGEDWYKTMSNQTLISYKPLNKEDFEDVPF